MGIEGYIVYGEVEDDGGKWFRVLTGASDSTIELRRIEEEWRHKYKLPELKIRARTDFFVSPELVRDPRKYRESLTVGRKPAVPDAVMETVRKFPYSVDYLIESMSVLSAGPSKDDAKKFAAGHRKVELDLPRGIKKKLLREQCEVFSEVVYEDNVFGDSVTVNVLKMREGHQIVGSIPSYYAQRILDTDEYAVEIAETVAVDGGSSLKGFKVMLETKKGQLRTYFVVSDPSGEWVYFSQSTAKTEEQMRAFLQMIGQSGGMLEYPEFHNTFYAIPDELGDGELFVGFALSRLRRRYARSKGYAKWAKAYVGYWSSHAMFKDPKKGNWSFALYDMLRPERREEVTALYDKKTAVKALDVYGTAGNIVYGKRWSRRRGRYIKTVAEINWPYDRYTVMVNNAESGWLGKASLLERANSLQLNREGGFAHRSAEEPADETGTSDGGVHDLDESG